MSIESACPQLSVRGTTFFGWAIPILVLFSLFSYYEPTPVRLSALILFSVIASSLAVPEMLQVLKLRPKKESKAMTLIVGVVFGLGILTLLILKDRGILVWNELYFTVPVTMFSVLIYTGCFLAEDKHSVRVYLALGGYHYVRA